MIGTVNGDGTHFRCLDIELVIGPRQLTGYSDGATGHTDIYTVSTI